MHDGAERDALTLNKPWYTLTRGEPALLTARVQRTLPLAASCAISPEKSTGTERDRLAHSELAQDDRQVELLTLASSEGRPLKHRILTIEWRWFGLAAVTLIAGGATLLVYQGIPAVAFGAAAIVLLPLAIGPVFAAGLLRGGEERAAHTLAVADIPPDESAQSLIPFRKCIPIIPQPMTSEQAMLIGNTLGVDWKSIPIEEFRRGLEVEAEHGARDPETDVTRDDPSLTGKIARAHLKEFPDYYTRLDRLEAEAKDYWRGRL